MIPNFALSLSFSGIQLLHRQDDGWGLVGEVDLASQNLSADLAALRSRADSLGSGPVETKLIIPDDQIKYLTVEAGTLGKQALQDAVLQALDGATPYDVSELAFDFANANGKVHIAAVARETLQEAEGFATEHGFAPLGFVAAPQITEFPKEPNFGVSDLAHQRGIDSLTSDAQAVVATGKAVPRAAKKPTPSPAPAADPAPAAPKPELQAEPPAAKAAPLPGFTSQRRAADQTPPEAAKTGPRLQGAQRDAKTASSAPMLSATKDQPGPHDLPGLSAPKPGTTVPDQAPPVTGKSTVALDESDVSIALAGLRPGQAADASDAALHDDLPPPPAGLGTAADTGGATLLDPASRVATDRSAPAQPDQPESAAASAVAKVRALFAKPAKTPQPEQSSVDEDEKQRMTVFGARKPKAGQDAVPIGGKPRFLGLILTAILLLFLVTVAAWATVFLEDGLARLFGGGDRERAIAELPVPVEPDADETDLAAPTAEPERVAALDDGLQDIDAEEVEVLDDGLSQVIAPPANLSPEEAAAKYAATGIWQATPEQPQHPGDITLDDVYAASIDGRITGQDAYALSQPQSSADTAPGAIIAPLPPGADFDLDDNGFVVATPEGALTPEGAVVFSGRPAQVPPTLPQRLIELRAQAEAEVTEAATAPDAATDTDAAEASPDQADTPGETAAAPVPSLRPRLRPATLIEDSERTQLGGNSRAELAKLRPRLRPILEKEVAEAETAVIPATAQAIAVSRKPTPRPSNFARTVEQAQRQVTQDTRVAAVAPRTVTPKIPSSASVASAATVKNAINLSRVNLIGVYGKPSSRRALVRLSNGRYKKVKVGDSVDGGRVSAIGESQLQYTKRGRNITLKMPKG